MSPGLPLASPRGGNRGPVLPLTHHSVSIPVPGAGHHRLRESPSVTLVAQDPLLPGGGGLAAGRVDGGNRSAPLIRNRRPSRGRSSGRGGPRPRGGLFLHNLHHRRVLAGPQHLLNRLGLRLTHGQAPSLLEFCPVGGVGAPASLVWRFPLVGTPAALGAAGPGQSPQ